MDHQLAVLAIVFLIPAFALVEWVFNCKLRYGLPFWAWLDHQQKNYFVFMILAWLFHTSGFAPWAPWFVPTLIEMIP